MELTGQSDFIISSFVPLGAQAKHPVVILVLKSIE